MFEGKSKLTNLRKFVESSSEVETKKNTDIKYEVTITTATTVAFS